jgi:hypothetical protein
MHSIFMGDESLVHHYDPELKSQSLEYHHTTSLRQKKSKTLPSTGKCTLTIFWDNRGTIQQRRMVKGTRLNSKTYVKTLKRLQQ